MRDNLGCVSQDTEPPESLPSFYGRAQKTWDRFEECNAQKLRSVMQTFEKTKVRRSETFKSKFLNERSPYAVKIEDR